MIRPAQTLMQTEQLRQMIPCNGKPISFSSLSRWAKNDPAFKACQFRRGWWSVTKLRALGVLP